MTPMQQQYNQIKSQHGDKIVLFRLGDFYEAFHEDAKEMSRVLGITLTGRGKDESRIPMAGIPYHALANYLPQLLEAGLKVAIVEQKTEAIPGQLVERDIAKIYTAGTLTDINNLEDSKPNFLVSIVQDKKGYALAVLDASTAELMLWENQNIQDILNEVGRLQAVECLLPKDNSILYNLVQQKFPQLPITTRDTTEAKLAYTKLTKQLGTQNLKGFGVEDLELAQVAATVAIDYVKECQRVDLTHIKSCRLYPLQEYMRLDANTIRNLELMYPQSGDSRSTLYYHLNHNQTPMGRRLLREWLLFPLLNTSKLQSRWDAIELIHNNVMAATDLAAVLSEVPDLARLTARVATNAANAREVSSIVRGVSQLQNLITAISLIGINLASKNINEHDLLSNLAKKLHLSTNLSALVDKLILAIHTEPPATITEGHIIADNFDSEIDALRKLRSGGKDLIAQIQADEITKTGISSLKVGFNNVFGYYIEVTNSHIAKVPIEYIRKQTLTNAERYITPELKELETKVLSAEAKLQELEYRIFIELRSELALCSQEILNLSSAVAEIDLLTNFGLLAKEYRYTKPELNRTNSLEIVGGRHPVVERLQPQFHANDLSLKNDTSFVVLTGPNMSGKSTYIRQIALIILMAQIGCFVPADKLNFSLVDRIFTRVGASDNLARGESTFMVEMQETANILNNATAQSLVILDEVGRGTSTYDGVAIAWAIAEDLIKRVKAKTLFATHYHELTQLSEDYKEATNLHVRVHEQSGEVAFTHAIAAGSINKSYGVHVAKLAGLPVSVQKRAAEILNGFEQRPHTEEVGDAADLSTAMTATGLAKKPATDNAKNHPKRPAKISVSQLSLDI